MKSNIRKLIERSSIRKRNGALIMELAASLLFVLPLVLVLLFAALELTDAYLIGSVLDQSALTAARDLAIAYPGEPTVAGSRIAQNVLAYDNIRISGVIASSAQFDDAVFDKSADPPTVTVTVHYSGGKYGLSPFPVGIPGLDKQFALSGHSVYRIEEN
ncbi:MAG: hypothetical protein K2X27_17090 [Candidatus Obscuribacterales bacterium]|nr:hypothetical protein [Candidatus Obscuribacterales bacterium]